MHKVGNPISKTRVPVLGPLTKICCISFSFRKTKSSCNPNEKEGKTSSNLEINEYSIKCLNL